MKFSASTFLWTSPFSTENLDLLNKVKQIGFDEIDIAIEEPSLINIKELKMRLNDLNLGVSICAAFGPERDFTHKDPKYHKICHDYLESLMLITKELGANYISGPIYSSTGKARQLPPEERKKEWELAVKNITLVGEKAKSYDIKIAIEPLNRFETDLCNTATDVKKLINDINLDNIGIMLDNFHMNIEEPNIEEAIKVAGEKLFFLQVSDSHRGIPGTGNFDWKGLKSGLKQIAYNKTIVIEGFTTDNKQLAAAVCIWKKMAKSQDIFASEGLKFLKNYFL